jgi:hypothetical protein
MNIKNLIGGLVVGAILVWATIRIPTTTSIETDDVPPINKSNEQREAKSTESLEILFDTDPEEKSFFQYNPLKKYSDYNLTFMVPDNAFNHKFDTEDVTYHQCMSNCYLANKITIEPPLSEEEGQAFADLKEHDLNTADITLAQDVRDCNLVCK